MGTINFVLIGARNTGKTCYLSVLSTHCPSISSASDGTTVYTRVQNKLLEAGDLPQATASSMRELLFRYSGGQYKVDFSIDDYDGAFIESLSDGYSDNQESRALLKARVQESEGLLFFMPYETTEKPEVLSSFEHEINTIISLVEEVTEGKYVKLPIPAVVCITKWDCSPDYQTGHDIEAATLFLNHNPYYGRALAKIETLFEHVSIQPISSFGVTEDGVHPCKGKIEPYNLAEPLHYCLDQVFPKFEKKITAFQESNDEVVLFEYLFELYDDLRHYKDGIYCKLYAELESKLANNILDEINKNKQKSLTSEQHYIIACIQQRKIHDDIETALKLHQSNEKNRKKRHGFLIVVGLLMIGVGITYFIKDTQEHKAYLEISAHFDSGKIASEEVVQKVEYFHMQWETPLGISMLRPWFAKDIQSLDKQAKAVLLQKEKAALESVRSFIAEDNIPLLEVVEEVFSFKKEWCFPLGSLVPSGFVNDCKLLHEQAREVVRSRLAPIFMVAESSEQPNNGFIINLQTMHTAVAQWQDLVLRKMVQDTIAPILASHQLLQDLRLAQEKAGGVSLSAYHKLHDAVANIAIEWSEMGRMIQNIQKAVFKRIKMKAMDAWAGGEEQDLERSVEDLAVLANDGDAEAEIMLKEQLVPKLSLVKRQRKLLTMVNQLHEGGALETLQQVVMDNFELGFTELQKSRVYSQLQQQLEKYEEQNIPSFRALKSKDEIEYIRDKIRNMNVATRGELQVGDEVDGISFRYQRPSYIQEKIDAYKGHFEKYERALKDGVKSYITFIGSSTKEGKLALACDDFNSEDELEITFDKSAEPVLPHNMEKRDPCKDHSVKWNILTSLKQGVHHIKVVEKDMFDDDLWSSTFTLSEAMIFEFINQGKVTVLISPYSLLLSEK